MRKDGGDVQVAAHENALQQLNKEKNEREEEAFAQFDIFFA